MQIAVVGLWHLGTVTAACLASAGYSVVAFDDNAEVVNDLQSCLLPVFEPGLVEMVRQGLEAGRLSFTSRPEDIKSAEIVWVAYDTPVDDDDHADVDFVLQKVCALYRHLKPGALVLISSQIPVGSTRNLEAAYRASYPEAGVGFAYSPENLRLGKAIDAFTRPERIVVGTRDQEDRARISKLLEPFCERIEWMAVESAEMTKHALNAFLATSVVFINELSTLCERVGADAREVERGLKSDVRIGPRAYVRPGSAFAGGTLARDISFLVDLGRREALPTDLFSSVAVSNRAHRSWPVRRLTEVLGGVRGRAIAVLGLTYKPGTNTLRRSSAVETCLWLAEHGARVSAYDPAVSSLPLELAQSIALQTSMEAALRDADAVLVATEWPDFASLKADDVAQWMARPVVLDPARFLEASLAKDDRIRYYAVGRSS